MSVYGMMRTGVSGMAAQSDRLSTVADNVANSATVGYKGSTTEFSSLLIDSTPTGYSSGGVETDIRHRISKQGTLAFTSSVYDLAINGDGFMLVSNKAGDISLTRAGAFVPDGEGNLINSGGFKLMGYPITSGSSVPTPANGTAGLVPIDIVQAGLEATATTSGEFAVNLPASAASVAPADMPSVNAVNSTYTSRSSLVVYGNLGEEKQLDVHYAKSTTFGEWEMSVFDATDRSLAGGFPYANPALATATLTFDLTGQLTSSAPSPFAFSVPGGANMTLDIAGTSQLAADYTVMKVNANGNGPSEVTAVKITDDGTISETYSNGATRARYRIPLANVISADRLVARSGNVFETSLEFGRSAHRYGDVEWPRQDHFRRARELDGRYRARTH